MADDDSDYPPEEAERRAGELARRLLTTPPKPQSKIKGKTSRQPVASTGQSVPAKGRPAR
jgi:hypothetical protein